MKSNNQKHKVIRANIDLNKVAQIQPINLQMTNQNHASTSGTKTFDQFLQEPNQEP